MNGRSRLRIVLAGLLWTGMAAGSLCRAESYEAKIGIWVPRGSEAYEQVFEASKKFLARHIPESSFSIVRYNASQSPDKTDIDALDFTFSDPMALVRMEVAYGVQRLATIQRVSQGKPYAVAGSAVFCLAGRSDIAAADQLRGKVIAGTHDGTLVDWFSAAREFKGIGIDPGRDFKEIQFVGDPERVVDAVVGGVADAGVVPAGTIERLAARKKTGLDQFRILEFAGISRLNEAYAYPFRVSTRLYPDWTWGVCPRTPDWLVRKVSTVLLGEAPKLEEVVALSGTSWTISRLFPGVHDCLKELRVAPYKNYGRISFAAVLRQYMYWFFAAGIAMVLMFLVTSYVTHLNRALLAEIDARKEAEVSLQKSIQRFEHVVSCSMDWIWETDRKGRFTYSSSIVTQMLGYPMEDILGKPQYELLTRSERERLGPEMLQLGVTQKGIFRERYKLLTREGRIVIHESTAAPILDAQGQVAGYRGVNRDITSQVRYVTL